MTQSPMHALPPEAALETLQSSVHGLGPENIAARRAQFGENRLPDAPPRPAWRRLLDQFNNVLLYVLMVSGLVTLLIGYHVDALVIWAVVLVNALVGFFQEGKAEQALSGILGMVVSEALVRRAGRVVQIPSVQLVPGDIVLISAGDRLPADVRLLETHNFHCDEAALTGESVPVKKSVCAVAEDAPLAERSGCAYMGTQATSGGALGVVFATGTHTELGRIGAMVSQVTMPKTPLTRQLVRFAHVLTVMILAITALAMAQGILVSGLSLSDTFRAAVGIAVAAIPEGLPAIVTVSLALGVQRMAHANALVRKLPAVEVLGSVTVICSDKTGTLTRNEMTARHVVTASRRYQVSGEGYAPFGDIESQGCVVDCDALPAGLQQLVRASLFCNDANVEEKDGHWLMHGDPTEGALHVLARKAGLSPEPAVNDWHRLDVIPFSTEQRYMAVLGHGRERDAQVYLKGAPERVLGFCSQQLGDASVEPLDSEFWHTQLDQLGAAGMRVLALAMKHHPPDDATLTEDELGNEMIFLGLVGITDLPRQEAQQAIDLCRQAGIRVMMITGDNARTAAAIGEQLGIRGDTAMTGAEVDALDDAALCQRLGNTSVFARTSPENKLRLVKALQARGDIVAMTGDGVNDAPALRRADIGVAMGRKGTDAARDAAAMVLTDDNFASIARAVEVGRQVYDNIVKAILFIVPTGLVEAGVLLLAVMLGLSLPITPVQVLWVNMITAVTLAIALAFEPGEADVMWRPPRPPTQGLFNAFVVRRLLLVGVVGISAAFWLFFRYRDVDIEVARTLVVTMLVWMETFYLFSCRRLRVPLWMNGFVRGIAPALLASVAVLLMQWAFTTAPWLQQLFHTQPLTAVQWLDAAFAGLLVTVAVELEKVVARALVGAGLARE